MTDVAAPAPERVRLLVLGAGGHGRVVADAALESGPGVQLVGFLDDDPRRQGTLVLDHPVLGSIADVANVPHDAVIAAIGDNAVRARLFRTLRARGERMLAIVHPRATISRSATIGAGSLVVAGAVINAGARISENVIINTGATVDHDCVVEDHAHVAPGVHLCGGCTVGANALVGVGTVVVPGGTIGRGSIVGAGSVVTSPIPTGVVAFGNPARVVRRLAVAAQPECDARVP